MKGTLHLEFATTVWRAARERRKWIVLAVLAQMVSPIAVLYVLGQLVAAEDGQEGSALSVLLMVAGAIGVVSGFVVSARLSSAAAEEMLDGIRTRLVRALRDLEYQDMERLGATRIYDSITRNSGVISEAAMVVMPTLGAIGALTLVALYTLSISIMVFAALAVVVGTSTFFYRISQREIFAQFMAAANRETVFLGRLSHLLHGFKESSLHRSRSRELVEDALVPASTELRTARIQTGVLISRGMAITYGCFYVLLITIAFVLPPYIGDNDLVVHTLYISFFMLSLVEIILKSLPLIARAEHSFSQISEIEDAVEAARRDAAGAAGSAPDFRQIALNAVVFDYLDSAGNPLFTLGPVDMTLNRGEVLFVSGDNGSGKSTLLKLLARLYAPSAGSITLDERPVGDDSVNRYRSLFSAVFADFHLFDRLYGMPESSEDEVNALLGDLGLGAKVRFENGAFSTTDLSTGQRKRLAFAVAILERRPIMILDELAADQDHGFRQRFFREILPRLKAEGRTLIVVSHDERYDDVADRRLAMVNGKLQDSRHPDEGPP